jgi:hypothetical protein
MQSASLPFTRKKIQFILLLGFLVPLLFISCKSRPSIRITKQEIMSYVDSLKGPEMEFSVGQSLRFSKEDNTYKAIEYLLGEEIVLHYEEINSENQATVRSIYYKKGIPVFISESTVNNSTDKDGYIEKEIYTNGKDILGARKRVAEYESELPYAEYVDTDADLDDYDLDKPKNAIRQTGEFEMKFGEFLLIDPEKYLILENEKSQYDVALFFMESDPLLDSLQARPDFYEGETIFVKHEFRLINQIERMIYRGGFIVEN